MENRTAPMTPIWTQVMQNKEDLTVVREKAVRLEMGLEKFMDKMEKKLEEIGVRMEEKFDSFEEKFDDKFHKMETKFDESIKQVEGKVTEVTVKTTTTRNKLDGGWKAITIIGALVVSGISIITNLLQFFGIK